jgi:hypothetical protein
MTICKECVHAVAPQYYSGSPWPSPLSWQCRSGADIDLVTGSEIRQECRKKNTGSCPEFVMISTAISTGQSYRQHVPWWKRIFS